MKTAIMLTLALAACGSRQVTDTSPNPPTFEIWRGPPCKMEMKTGDGRSQGKITHQTARCRVIIDDQEQP